MYRKDKDILEIKDELEFFGAELYRGTGLTKEELKTYKDKIGNKYDPVVLTGFISTSLDRSQAENFAWSNPKSGHESTIFEILWK